MTVSFTSLLTENAKLRAKVAQLEKSQPSLKEVLREVIREELEVRSIADEKALRAKKAADSRSQRMTGRR
jgi:hypothetical protein